MSLAPRDPTTGLVRVVIDTPRGSRNKYKFDEELGLFKLSRVLPAGLSFPFDFGSIPGTRAEDGDALDVLVMTEAPLYVGCLVHVHLVGIMRATQREEAREDIARFYRTYNEAHGRKFVVAGFAGAKAAEAALRQASRT